MAVDAREAAPAVDPAVEIEERTVGVLALMTLFAWLALVYAWQAWLVTTPVIFTDELLYAELSRSVAATGEPALRGAPHALESLSVIARAPAWLIDDPERAYFAAKLIGVVSMAAVVFPAYGLARLLVAPWPAVFAAAGTAAIPALSYSGLLLEEPFAYPVATLAFFLGVRAIAKPSPDAVVAAVLAAVAAPFVRGQLILVPVVLVVAALAVAWTSESARRRLARAYVPATAALVVIGALALFALHRVALDAWAEWDIATDRPRAMLEQAVWAAAALTIGLGVLPVVAALASLVRPAGAAPTRARRAFTVLFVAAVPAFALYTAGKGAWLGTMLEPRILERNLIYLAPLVFAGAALWLDRPGVRPLAAVGAGLAVLPLLLAAPIELRYPYFEAPGYALAAFANRELIVHGETIELLLLVVLAVSAGVVLLARRAPWVAAVAAAAVLAWNAGGEVYASLGLRDFSQRLESGLPRPADWVDRTTGNQTTLYLGQQLSDLTTLHLLEFWNDSLSLFWTLDRSVLEPGPTGFPAVDQATGALVPDPGLAYAVVDPRITIVGDELARSGNLGLFRVAQPLRLQETVEGLYADGWVGTGSAYNRYWTPAEGSVEVLVGRLGWGGRDVPAPVVVRVGPLSANAAGLPQLASVSAERQWVVRAGRQRVFRIAAPPAPFRVEVSVGRTFVPAELDPSSSDVRALGAQVSYRFAPSG